MLSPPSVRSARCRSPYWTLMTLVAEMAPLSAHTHAGQPPPELQSLVVMGVVGAVPPFTALTHGLLTGESWGRKMAGLQACSLLTDNIPQQRGGRPDSYLPHVLTSCIQTVSRLSRPYPSPMNQGRSEPWRLWSQYLMT